MGLSLSNCGHVFANSVRSCGQLAPFKHPSGQGAPRVACFGQAWDNLLHRGVFGLDICAISQKRGRQVFAWIRGEARIQAKPATQNLVGAPSRLAWVYSPGLDLSAGGLFGVQQSKAGGWGVCIVLTPFAVLPLRFYSVYL